MPKVEFLSIEYQGDGFFWTTSKKVAESQRFYICDISGGNYKIMQFRKLLITFEVDGMKMRKNLLAFKELCMKYPQETIDGIQSQSDAECFLDTFKKDFETGKIKLSDFYRDNTIELKKIKEYFLH